MDVALGFDPGRGEFDSHYPYQISSKYVLYSTLEEQMKNKRVMYFAIALAIIAVAFSFSYW